MPPVEPTTRTLTIRGADLHVACWGEGEPLVLLHGFTGTGADWRQVFDLGALAQRYRVIVPDARGHGRSENPSGVFTQRECARDLAALLDALGVARCRAVGMSLGGNTLLHLATREPERIQRMVLVSATMYYPESARAIMRGAAPEAQSAAEWEAMRARHVRGDEQIRALWSHAQGFAKSYDDMTFTPPELATIRARTLIVYGDRDPLYPVDMALAMFRAIPRASLCVMPDAGHGPIFAGRARDAFVAEARAFLAADD